MAATSLHAILTTPKPHAGLLALQTITVSFGTIIDYGEMPCEEIGGMGRLPSLCVQSERQSGLSKLEENFFVSSHGGEFFYLWPGFKLMIP